MLRLQQYLNEKSRTIGAMKSEKLTTMTQYKRRHHHHHHHHHHDSCSDETACSTS